MKKPTNGAIAAMIAVLVSVICGAAPVMAQQPQNPAPIPGGQCCGMSPWGSGPTLTCAVERRCVPSGCEAHPATVAPAGSNRSSCGDNEAAEASGVEGHRG
jgi:hypothetical protein